MSFRRKDDVAPLRIGNRVRIRASNRSPYPGRFGTIVSVDGSGKSTYVVDFDDGLRFRYEASEFDWAEPRESSGARAGSTALLLAFIAMLVACSGPAAKSEPEPATVRSNDS